MILSVQSFCSCAKQQDQKVKCLVFILVAAELDLILFLLIKRIIEVETLLISLTQLNSENKSLK